MPNGTSRLYLLMTSGKLKTVPLELIGAEFLSLFCFDQRYSDTPAEWEWLFKCFKLGYKRPKPSNYNQMEWHIGCKPIELLQSLQQLSNLSSLRIQHALDLLSCDIALPPCITKLTLRGISCMNDDGMNAIGNLPKLRLLKLYGGREFEDSFEINCTAGSFSQLQDFEINELNVRSWKLASGAMPCLQSLVVILCERLQSD
ncbi:hypothetical protein PIB30_035963 [Stylosanthes scabra]|uniref:Uncharacterized protein n=1 Tax=Stylosanthes scabra TaxID=79078 RepID=A0ABU6RDH3_9FABA|nr:hypothetical protein [Stylosanthes scabra]